MFLSSLKPIPRFTIFAIIIGAAAWAALKIPAINQYLQPSSQVAVAIPAAPAAQIPTTPAPAPQATGTTIPTAPVKSTLRVKTIPWNGTLGMLHAKASDAYKARGLDVQITREDDYPKLIADMAAFAKDPGQGSHFVIIMGDGLPAFAIGANAALKPFNQEMAVIAGIGYSLGEDKCIIDGAVDVRGSLIAGYFGDGDINICLKYAYDNGIEVNVDPKKYVPKAMNLTNRDSFVLADQAFIASAKQGLKGGGCEERTNTETGKMQSVCVSGTATWTPGDSNVFFELKKMGRSMRVLASTKDYPWQMPTAVIGNKQWMERNRSVVEAFLAATFESGELVKTNNQALMVAAAEQAAVTKEHDASYWASMFKSVAETGPDGKTVSLGGSTTNGLADAANLFGLNGADNLYKLVYSVYGNWSVQYFPDLMPGGLLKYESVVDTSYVSALLAKAKNVAKADTPTYSPVTTSTFAARSVSIEFESGKATFTPKASKVLDDVLNQAAISAMNVQLNGHTDSVGNPDDNLELSKARAEAVKKFLMTNAPANFPADRVQTRGFGDTQPIADNKTAAGKAQNRRVEIILRK